MSSDDYRKSGQLAFSGRIWIIGVKGQDLCGFTDRQTDRQTETEGRTDRQTEADTPTHVQAGRQADRRTGTHTYIHTYVHTYTHERTLYFLKGEQLQSHANVALEQRHIYMQCSSVFNG